MISVNHSANSDKSELGNDTREALFNGGAIGAIRKVQVSTDRITSLDGILYDLDPDIFRPGDIIECVPPDPAEFYAAVVQPLLSRHPVLNKAEVRNSGRGLHAILRFDPPIEFKTEGERERWAGIVETVQAALPIDPDQPGITATTRALGSINSKNGMTVAQLSPGKPVTVDEVLELHGEMIEAPFRTVMRILTGDVQLEPCPFCGKAGTKFSALKYDGRCYGSCGNVKIEQLYDLVLAPRAAKKEVAANA